MLMQAPIYDDYDKGKEAQHTVRTDNDTQQANLLPAKKLPYTFFTFEANSKIYFRILRGLLDKCLNIPDVYTLPNFLDEAKKRKAAVMTSIK